MIEKMHARRSSEHRAARTRSLRLRAAAALVLVGGAFLAQACGGTPSTEVDASCEGCVGTKASEIQIGPQGFVDGFSSAGLGEVAPFVGAFRLAGGQIRPREPRT